MADPFKLEYQFDPPVEDFIVPEGMELQALNELEVTMTASEFLLHNEVFDRTPHFMGFLRNSILPDTVTITGNIIQGGVGTAIPYALPVEEGAKPHWIPIEPLKRWAKLKYGDEGIAYAFQLNHAPAGAPRIVTLNGRKYIQRGKGKRLRAFNMFSKGLSASKSRIEGYFNQCRDRIIRKWGEK